MSKSLPFVGMTKEVFQMAQRGTTVDEIVAFVKQRGGNSTRMLRWLRRGYNDRGIHWGVEEEGGKIKVTFPV